MPNEHRTDNYDHQPFPPTNWRLVAAAGQAARSSGEEALEKVMQLYWPILLRYVESRFRLSRAAAEDLLQEFVLQKVLRQGMIERARAERGRFRIFLINSLNNFVISEFRRHSARKRSPGAEALDGGEELDQVAAEEKASEFDRQYASAVFRETIRRMKAECEESARLDIWGVFEGRFLLPLAENSKPVAYDKLIQQFELSSNIQASNVLTTGKRMFSRIFRAVVEEFTPCGSDVETETRMIKELLAK